MKLPWEPIIGWVWRVTHVVEGEEDEEERGGRGGEKKTKWRVTEHNEKWEIEPWEGVKQVFRDGRGKRLARDI